MSSSPRNKISPTASPTFSFTDALPLLPQPMSISNAKVSVKLDEEKENFLIWRQLVEPVIKGHRLHMFLTDSAIGHNAGSNNDGFNEKDQILLSWILSTLSESMLKRVIGCTNSKQLWETLHNFFKNRARAKGRQYASELNNIMKKDTESISEYLLRIKILIDSLDFAGRSVNLQEHVNVILGGLPKEYDASVTLINNELLSADPFSVDDIEYMLLASEVCIEKKSKVQNNKESDESDRQNQLSLNGDIFSGQHPIPQLRSTNSFLQKYLPNVAASAAASNSQYSPPPVFTPPLTLSSYHAALMNMRPPNPMTMSPHSPHPQPQLQQYPLPPSYSSALPIPNQTTELGLYDRCLVPQ
ncbi:retrovirus-related Pol polyprotein from transposon TNT 1-94 [Trifolium pratense]|uniref:Retrovirus-related Pol polyprotein from transposon TNT 1-94 n=1 Tax=Trifolium pratense TaxID=57577 RepID=A0A2K3LLH9_TRIPR|nr:retrovirus-related Pol polyprotein from transposon TNT 1-94 [Trifolium pratense]